MPYKTDGTKVELWFYSPDGESANDFGINNWGQTQLDRVTDKYQSGQKVKSYGLTKYQGKHNTNNEGYDRLSTTADGSESSNLGATAAIAKGAKGSMFKVLPSIGIATVRNRRRRLDGQVTPFGSERLLEDMVIQLLPTHNDNRIHCYFCRNRSTNATLNAMNRKLAVRRI